MNYAPAEFQNVRFQKICEPPFVKIVALRDIAPGEELRIDYGPNYRYDFMKDEAVIKFFADLRAARATAAAKRRRLAPPPAGDARGPLGMPEPGPVGGGSARW